MLVVQTWVLTAERKFPKEMLMNRWSAKMRDIHETFSREVFENSEAKTWIIFGEENRIWYEKTHDHEIFNGKVDEYLDATLVQIFVDGNPPRV
jgi:5-methylthioribose kinase